MPAGKDNFQQVLSAIEALATSSVLLDTKNPQEVKDFVGSLKQIQAQAKKDKYTSISDLIGVFADSIAVIGQEEESRINDVIAYSINVLQDYARQVSTGINPNIDIGNIKANLCNITGQVKVSMAALSAVQLKEIPDFISNTQGRMDDIEKDILEVEKASNIDCINSALRAFHTIKGESGILGLTNIAELSHEAESILQKGKNGDIKLDTEIINLILSITDVFKDILKILEKDIPQALSFDISSIKGQINTVIKQKSPEAKKEIPADPAVKMEEDYTCCIPEINIDENKDMLVEFINESCDHLASAEDSLLVLENSPESPEEINKTFRAFHTIKGVASFLNLEDIRTLTHETETMMDLVRKGSLSMNSQVADAVFAAIDGTRKLMGLLKEQIENNGQLKSAYFDVSGIIKTVKQVIKCSPQGKPQVVPVKIGELLVNKGVIEEKELEVALEKQQEVQDKKIGEILVEMKSATPAQIERSLQEQQQQASLVEQTVKISVGKLDNLIDMVGELVIIGTQVAQNSFLREITDSRLVKDMAQLGRIIRDTQDISMSMRLVQIKPVFQKMQRLVRDLSKKSNKQVEMKMSGEDTEIDKNIIDLISDPIMHMIRNAIDHGIEPEETRVKNGKPAVGNVELNAYHKGGNIVIEIKDDGGGLNKDKILKKAIEKGLIKENEVIAENKIFSMIFEPGFSTADKITDISGRGVGMDVVKRNVEQLRGKIDIISEMGKGTTFYIKSPLTLAIIDGIILMVGQERYIIPIFSIVEFFKPNKSDITFVNGSPSVIMVHGNLYPLIFLSEHFKVASEYEDNIENATVCLVESDYGRGCLVVDRILGQQQIVIKTLGESFKDVKGLSGGTILGDGRVGLILDVNGIIEGTRR